MLIQRPMGDKPSEWTTLRTGLLGTATRLASTRCPDGCRFRVHAQSIGGWTIYSNASGLVRTIHEPPMLGGACRVELSAKLPPVADVPGMSAAMMEASAGVAFAEGIALALGVTPTRVRFVYAYSAPQTSTSTPIITEEAPADDAEAVSCIVLDFLPSPAAELAASLATSTDTGPSADGVAIGQGGHTQASADELAMALAALMASHARELYARGSTQGIVSAAGLIRVRTPVPRACASVLYCAYHLLKPPTHVGGPYISLLKPPWRSLHILGTAF